MRATEFVFEALIEPSAVPNTMSLWHGGDLDSNPKYKSGRTEYGPGLYLITKYDVAIKYAKGSRKLYMVTIEKGNAASDVKIDLDKAVDFVNTYVAKSKKQGIIARLENLAKIKNDGIVAQWFINIMINEDAIKPSQMNTLRQFLVDNRCDYEIQKNPFGWSDSVMIVLFNMNKVTNIKQVKPGDKIAEYDLPNTFN